ncbi:MAG: hypothetical protein KF892_23640 [Rhizobacter sp.]|nr:hypothetical protein [Rhizobacter sp.]
MEYLAITGRTKERASAIEKIARKGYSDPGTELTDLTGIRVVLFSETDVKKAGDLVEKSFAVDKENSLNQDDLLNTNQTGYRSVHFVCDLGRDRRPLPEFDGLAGLRFEIQLRTVLQHAWAELSHDRNYKFSGKLPRELERRLYLYAGLLEIADKGFDELSRSIDEYSAQIETKSEQGVLSTELNSITLRQFVNTWSENTGVPVEDKPGPDAYSDLVRELSQFGIQTLADLNALIPKRYVELAKKRSYPMTTYGIVREWMLAHDWRRFERDVERNWIIPKNDADGVLLKELHKPEEFAELLKSFGMSSKIAKRAAGTKKPAARKRVSAAKAKGG